MRKRFIGLGIVIVATLLVLSFTTVFTANMDTTFATPLTVAVPVNAAVIDQMQATLTPFNPTESAVLVNGNFAEVFATVAVEVQQIGAIMAMPAEVPFLAVMAPQAKLVAI
jgi:hypothetical protein